MVGTAGLGRPDAVIQHSPLPFVVVYLFGMVVPLILTFGELRKGVKE